MRKIVALALVVMMVLVLGAAASAAPKWTFKMGHANPAGTPYDETAHKFAELVAQKTNGQVEVNIFPNNQLGDWTETFELISRGVVEMGFQIANAQYDPKLNFAYYMPYVVRNVAEGKEAYSPGGWAFDIIRGLWVEHGIQPLAVWPVGTAGVSLKSMPPSPGDPDVPKKMKVRVMGIEACSLTYEALGYIATPIPYAEVYTAIQTGIVEGQQGGPPFQAWSFRDVNNVWIQYNDYFETHWVTINKDIWDSLPADVQAAMQEAANEASALRWGQVETEDAEYRKILKDDFGWEIVMLTDEELDACASKVRKVVWPKMKELLGEELYTKVRLHALSE
jgi:TRAP-type C4-dicarboxylate transport system substrate-binding protein